MKSRRRRSEKTMKKAKTQSAPNLPARMEQQGKARMLPSSPSRTPASSSSNQSQGKKERTFPKGNKICVVDRQALKRDLSSQRRALLRPPFKCTAVDRRSMKDPRNLSDALEIITPIRNTGGNLDYLARAKNS